MSAIEQGVFQDKVCGRGIAQQFAVSLSQALQRVTVGAVRLLEAFVVDELVAEVVQPQHIGVRLICLPLVPG